MITSREPNAGQLADEFRAVTCDNSSRETLLIFPSINITEDVIYQLCGLTPFEFLELFNDFRNDFDEQALLEQV